MKLLYLRPSDIRFTQDSISSRFRDGDHVNTVANELMSDYFDEEDFSTMEVFRDERDRNYYTRNNRMLYAFRVAECLGRIDSIPVFEDQKRTSDNKKFTTKNNGTTIRVRNDARTLNHFDNKNMNRDLSTKRYQSVLQTSMAPRLRVDWSLKSIPRQQRDRFVNYVLGIHDRSTAIYTDGFKFPDGAGIAMYIPDDGIVMKQRCSNRLSSCDLELQAISSALEWIVDYGDSHNYAILSDCLNCIKVIGHSGDGSHSHQHRILRDIISLHDQASDLGANIEFVWVPGHAGIEGNEIADKYARAAAIDESFDWDPIWTNEYEY